MSALTWITNKAKSIRRGHKTMTWKSAIKKAGAEYRASRKARPAKAKKVSRKKAKRVSHAKRPAAKRKVSGNYSSKRIGSGVQKVMTDLGSTQRAISYYEGMIRYNQERVKAVKPKSEKAHYRKLIALDKKILASYKKHLTNLKRHI